MAYLFRGDGRLAGLAEFLNRLWVEAEILLAANQDLGDIRAEVMYFRAPLLAESCQRTCGKKCAPVAKARLTFSPTLSRESGESMAKQIKMT